MDQHTNKHSKLINAKNKLPNQTSIADDYLNTSLTLSIKDTNEKSTNFYETNMIDEKNIVEQSLKKLTKSKTIQLEQQDQEQGDNHSQEDDHSNEIINTMVTSQITNIEANDATVNNNTVIVNTPDSNMNIKNLEPCNTLSGNIDYSSDESISNNNNKIRSNDILSLHNKNPDYIIRNRHSLDPNFATLNISNNKYSDSIDITNSSSVTMNSSNTNIQMTSITEKQIVAPIFSPPSLLLFDRVTQHNEFPYEMTRQVQFSPPLSPILHPPCASLPLDITAESAYDLSDRLLSKMNISDDSSKLNNLINKRLVCHISPYLTSQFFLKRMNPT